MTPIRRNRSYVGIVIVKCCREWPIVAGSTWRRCGYCGRHPEFERTTRDVVEVAA